METTTRDGTHAVLLTAPTRQFVVVRGYQLDTDNFAECHIGVVSAENKAQAAALSALKHGAPLHVEERVWTPDEFEDKVAARHASRLAWSRRHPAAA